VVTGLEFWAPCDSVGPPNWEVWSAADTALSESIIAAHVKGHSTAMICSAQKCNWLCCNVGCHVFRNRLRII